MGKKKIAYINPLILKWGRMRTPKTTIKISGKIIEKEQLEKWENGEEDISINEAKELAKIYGIPFAAMYLSKIPADDNTTYTDRRTYKDNIDDKESYSLWKEINRMKACRENALEFIDIFEYENALNRFRTQEKDTRKISDEVREIFKINTPFKNKSSYGDKAFMYYRNLMERKGIIVLQIEGIDVIEIRGLSLNYDVLPIIAVNKNDSDRAKVFTIIHELCHLIRRTSNLCLIEDDTREDKEEKECNKLAAEILMPEKIFREEINKIDIYKDEDLEKISDKFAVSKFVIIKRLYDLKIISYNIYEEMYNENQEKYEQYVLTKQKNKKKNVPISRDITFVSQNGYLYPRIVLNAYYEGKASFGEVCNIFNVGSKYIDGIERMVMKNE